MPEIASSGEAPKNKPAIKQDILMQKKSGTIDRKMVGGSERLKEITKNQLGALDSVVINQNIIKRFGNRAANIRERFDTLNAQYKEDTGLVMKGMDKIVGVFGGETVQSTYESMIGNLQREAAAMLREIDSIVPKVVRHFTRDQVAEMNITLRTLSGILGDTLNVPTFGEMAGTTARSLGSAENWKDGASNALHGAKGVLEGVTESVWMVIKSIPDLAIFCYNFATQESTRDATAKFMVGVGGFITENAWKGETWTKASVIIGDTISKEMKRIATLPQGEQAEAIGRIPGLIIGALVGGGIVLKGAAKFGKGMEALGTTIQKAEGATKLKKVGGKILEKTGALAVGVGETGDLVFGAKRLKKKKIREGESTSTNGIPEALNQRISEMSARLLAVGSKESTLNPDIAKMLLQMRKDLIATENAGNMQQVEALLKKADTYFDTHNRLMFPDQRLIHDPHAREIQSRIFAMMTNYSAHRPLSELGPRGREIGDEADRLYRELQRALASKNPEQFDKILKDCDRFQQNPDKYLDGQTVETIDEVVNTLGDVGENQIINNGDVIDWSKDIGEKLVQLKEFLGDMKSIPITKLKQFLDDLGLSLKNSVHLSSGVSLKMTEKIVQIRQRFFPVDGLFVKGQMINYRLGDGSIGKVRLERWNEQTGLWDVSWKDKNGVIRMQKDISMEGYVPSVEAEKLIKNGEKKSLDQKQEQSGKQKNEQNQNNQQAPEKNKEVNIGKARMTEIDPASFPRGELSRDAEKIFRNTPGLEPKYKIVIEGREFFVSSAFGARKTILGYTKVNGVYEPRWFYFSQSGGNWHCSQGVLLQGDGSYIISKGQGEFGLSYEKGTVVDSQLSKMFDDIPKDYSNNTNLLKIWKAQMGVTNVDKSGMENLRKRYKHEFQSTKLYQNADSFGDLDKGLSIGDVKQKMSSIPIDPKFDMNFRGGFRKGPDMTHEHLKRVETIIGKTYWNGKPIEITFAHAADNPDLMWIENIVFKDSPLNSHGIPTQQVDGGLLTAKPLDYWDQVPTSIENIADKYGKDYRDIRPYIQSNPLIIRFKELQGYQKAA